MRVDPDRPTVTDYGPEALRGRMSNRKAGAPSRLTRPLVDAICSIMETEMVAEGTAVTCSGIPRRTWERWKSDNEWVRDRIAMAVGARDRNLVGLILKLCQDERRPDPRTAMELAARMSHQDYGKHDPRIATMEKNIRDLTVTMQTLLVKLNLSPEQLEVVAKTLREQAKATGPALVVDVAKDGTGG